MQMWRNPVLAAAAIAATLVTAATVSVAQEENAGVIQYRKAVMSGMGGHMGAISRIVRGEVDFADHLAAHAQALNDLANMIPDAFSSSAAAAETGDMDAVTAAFGPVGAACQSCHQTYRAQ
jgi:cytochrome c556